MATLFTSAALVAILKAIEKEKTVYALGMWGQEITEAIIVAKAKQYPSWYTAERQAKLRKLIGKGYHGFDCVCLWKSILWGYPKQKYASNGVPDFGADSIMNYCTDVLSDMTDIEAGEALWMSGHTGAYIGDGLVIECTSKWTSDVLISNLSDRKWLKHGKLKWINYSASASITKAESEVKKVSIELEVLKKGSKGNQVKTLQRLLNAFGAKLEIDGSFGALTLAAVKAYQSKNGLVADGSVGKLTWSKLLAA